MNSFTFVIVFITLGSFELDSNIQELCSKKYFDSIYVKKSSGGNKTLVLERMKDSESSPKTVHSWNLLIEEKNKNFKTLDISYTSKKVMENSTLDFIQPKECPIDIITVLNLKNFIPNRENKWKLKDFFITNIKKGEEGKLQVNYSALIVKVLVKGSSEEYIPQEFNESVIKFIESTQLSSISMIGILCKSSDKSMYAIVEEVPPNPWNRTQFLARLLVKEVNVTHKEDQGPERKTYVFTFRSELRFWLDLKNQSIVEFLGIDCKVIKKGVINDSVFISTDTLFVIFWSFLGSAIILSIVDTALIIRRNRKKKIPKKIRNTIDKSETSSGTVLTGSHSSDDTIDSTNYTASQ